MPPRALHERPARDGRGRENADRGGAVPAPRSALHDRERQQREARGQQQGTAQVRQRPPPRRATLDEDAPSEHDGGDPERHVDQERQPPVVRLHQCSPQRRAETGGRRRGRTPQADGVCAPFGRERCDDERERCRDEQCRARGLHGASRDQQAERRRDRAQHRGDGEEHDARGEHASPAEEIREPAGGDEERGEDDVVAVEDP